MVPDFVTLGMLIIDEIHFPDGRPAALDVLGGAGPWAVIGARMFRPLPSSECITWIAHKGSDFPPLLERQIKAWQTACKFVDTPDRLTTRGWNQYGADELRAFKYMTEKLRIDQDQLTEPMLLAKSFHLICTPARCISLVKGILNKRIELERYYEQASPKPFFVWEPVPDGVSLDVLDDVIETLKYVDVISPNHQELGRLFGTGNDLKTEHGKKQMQSQCALLLERGFAGNPGVVVVRCGEYGCYVVTAKDTIHIPPYHTDGLKVVDPTGAGNAFLGAFCVGLVDAGLRDDVYEVAARYGSLAAGCAVEQVGLPTLQYEGDKELWNGLSISERRGRFNSS